MKISELEPTTTIFPKTQVNKPPDNINLSGLTNISGERPRPVRIHVIKNHHAKPVTVVSSKTPAPPSVIQKLTNKQQLPTSTIANANIRSNSVKRPKLEHFFVKNVQNWTLNDVCKWIMRTCTEYDLPRPYPVDRFIMNGKALLLLTKQDFVNRSKFCGDVLYHALVNFISEKGQSDSLSLKPNKQTALVPKSASPLVPSTPLSTPAPITTLSSSNATNKCFPFAYNSNYYALFNEATSPVYNVDGIIHDMDRVVDNSTTTDDGLYDYLKYLNDMSLSGMSCSSSSCDSKKHSTYSSSSSSTSSSSSSSSYSSSPWTKSSSSSAAPSPPPPYQSIKYSTTMFSSSSSTSSPASLMMTSSHHHHNTNIMSTSPPPPPSPSSLPSLLPPPATTTAATVNNNNNNSKINFNYTNNQVHYHFYDMNYFNDLTTTTNTTKNTSNHSTNFTNSTQSSTTRKNSTPSRVIVT